jgi:hypothetical protein
VHGDVAEGGDCCEECWPCKIRYFCRNTLGTNPKFPACQKTLNLDGRGFHSSHFSAQTELYFSPNPPDTPKVSQKIVLISSREASFHSSTFQLNLSCVCH